MKKKMWQSHLPPCVTVMLLLLCVDHPSVVCTDVTPPAVLENLHVHICKLWLFSTVVHLLIMVDVFIECGMWEIFVQGCSLVVTMVWVYQFHSIALLLAIFAPLKKQA